MALENIFQQYQTPVKSVQDYSNAMDAAEQNKLQLAALRAAGQKTQQDLLDDQTYRQAAIAAGGDQNKLIQALNSAGLAKRAQEIQKFQYDNKKQEADIGLATAHGKNYEQQTATSKQEEMYKAAAHQAQSIAYVQTPEDVAMYIKQGISKGLFPQMDDAGIQQKIASFENVEDFKKKAMDASIPVLDRYKVEAENARNELTNQTSITNNQLTNKTSSDNNSLTNKTSASNNAATVGATLRGQSLVDARSREDSALRERVRQDSLSKPIVLKDANGSDVLVQMDKTGKFVPVQGYSPKGDEKPLTDTQAKALLFGGRMDSANKIIGDLGSKGTNVLPPFSTAGYGIGAVSTAMQPEALQKLQQAQRDFVNAAMRRESGAAISQSEFDNANKQYFPQVGDSKGVIEQKTNARRVAMELIHQEIPKNSRAAMKAIVGGQPQQPNKVVNFMDLK